jgi:hypothetical protein
MVRPRLSMFCVLNIKKQYDDEKKPRIPNSIFMIGSCKRFLYISENKEFFKGDITNSQMYEGKEALSFLLSVCCGLENDRRPGEAEIYNQVKSSWQTYNRGYPIQGSKIKKEIDYVLAATSNIRGEYLNQIRKISNYSAIKDLLEFGTSDSLSILIDPQQSQTKCFEILGSIFSSKKRFPKQVDIVFSDDSKEKDVEAFIDALIIWQQKRKGAVLDFQYFQDYIKNPKKFTISFVNKIDFNQQEKILYLGKDSSHIPPHILKENDLAQKKLEIQANNQKLLVAAREQIDIAVEYFYNPEMIVNFLSERSRK